MAYIHPRTKFIRGTTSVISEDRDHLIGAQQLLCLVTGQTGDAYWMIRSAALLGNETYFTLSIGSHQPPTL